MSSFDSKHPDSPTVPARAGGFARGKGLTRRRFAYVASVGLASALVIGLPRQALAEAPGGPFVDSLGRKVDAPSPAASVMPLGGIAQCLVCTLFPEALASNASEIDEADGKEYRDAGMAAVPRLPDTGGASSSGTGDVDPRAARRVGADVMLDAGFPRDGLAGELDALQASGGVPCAFLDVSFGRLPQAYRMLGALLGRRQRAEQLASYVEAAMARAASVRGSGGPCAVFYAPRERGLEARSGISAQIAAIGHVGARAVTSPYGPGGVSVARVGAAGADLVVFDDTGALGSLAEQKGPVWDAWGACPPVARGGAAVSPALIHSWFGSPVHLQSIGALWLAAIIWPSSCPYDVAAEADAFYRLFYGLDKGRDCLAGLVGAYREEGYAHEG